MTLSEVAQIAQSVSVTLADLIAIYGCYGWSREHIGKRRIELTEDVRSLFYQGSDAIDQMRNPFAFGGEVSSCKQLENEELKHKQAFDAAYVLIERFGRHSELFAKLHAVPYRFMAQVRVDKSKPFDAVNTIVNELIFSAHELARLATVPDWSLRSEDAEQKHHDRHIRMHNI